MPNKREARKNWTKGWTKWSKKKILAGALVTTGAVLAAGAAGPAAAAAAVTATGVVGLGVGVYATKKAVKKIRNYRLDKMALNQRIKIINRIGNKIRLGKEANYGSTAFKDIADKRLKDVSGFDTAKINGALVKDTLAADTEDNREIKKAIQNALKGDENRFLEAQKIFENLTADLKTNGKSADHNITLFYMLREDMHNEIIAQRDKAVTDLKKLFDPIEPSFKERLEKVFPNQTMESIQKALVDNLEAAYKKQLDDFNKSTSDTLINLQDLKTKKSEKYSITHVIGGSEVQEALKNQDKDQVDQTTIRFGDKDTPYEREVSKLQVYISKTGKTYKKSASGAYAVDFNSLWGDKFYHFSMFKNIVSDFTELALLSKAAGHDPIVAKINFPANEEYNIKMAKAAFQAMLDAGYPPDRIKIEVKIKGVDKILKTKLGKDEKGEGFGTIAQVLYGGEGDPGYQSMINSSQKGQEQVKEATKTNYETNANNESMKQEFKRSKENAKNKASSNPPQSTPSSGASSGPK